MSRETVQLNAASNPRATALYGVTSSLQAASRGEPSAHPLNLVEQGLKLVNAGQAADWQTAAIHVAASADFYAAAARFVPSLAEQEQKARALMRKHRINSGSAPTDREERA
jgi:hypothetical protein